MIINIHLVSHARGQLGQNHLGGDGVGLVGGSRPHGSPEHPVEVHRLGVLAGDLPEHHGAVSIYWLHLLNK